jgi:FAD:protein FMN transferase
MNKRFRAMASACEIKLSLANGETPAAAHAVAAAIAEVARIEAKYSRYQTHSTLSQINASAGGNAVRVDEETAALLDFAEQCFVLSDGLFDVTSGILRRVWRFNDSAPQPPSDADIAALLPLIGWRMVQWQRPWVRLARPDMQLDFGGFGKEYAADRAAGMLLAHGFEHALVNLGGDVRVTGPQRDAPWRIGIQHPREVTALSASIELASGGLATSGDYERYFLHNGQRYCHLLNPRTGRPVQTAQAVSVRAPLCTLAGALATCALLKGDEIDENAAADSADAGVRFLQAQGAQFLWIARDGSVVSSTNPAG